MYLNICLMSKEKGRIMDFLFCFYIFWWYQERKNIVSLEGQGNSWSYLLAFYFWKNIMEGSSLKFKCGRRNNSWDTFPSVSYVNMCHPVYFCIIHVLCMQLSEYLASYLVPTPESNEWNHEMTSNAILTPLVYANMIDYVRYT